MEKNNYIRGLLGSIIGALIGAYPLMFIELKYGLINFIAGILIGFCSFLGFMMFKGRVKNFAAMFINFAGVTIALIIYDFVMSGLLLFDSGLYPSIKNILVHYTDTYSKIMLFLNTLYRGFIPCVVVIIMSIIFIRPVVKLKNEVVL